MYFNLLEAITALLLAATFHELGHFLVALAFGEALGFRFAWGKLGCIPVPRLLWTMPQLQPWQQRCIAGAGFLLEYAMLPIMLLISMHIYLYVILAHLAFYPFYAGDASDFRYFKGWIK